MRLWFLGLTLLFGCASSGNHVVPDTITDIPWRGEGGDLRVREARHLSDRGQSTAALAVLELVFAEHPRQVDGHRLRQDILRAQGRNGCVRAEAQERVRAWDDDPRAQYLLGRIAPGNTAKLDAFRAVVERDPTMFWGWLGLAYAMLPVDLEQSIELYRSLYAASGAHPIAARGYASALRSAKRYDEALAVYEAMRTDVLVLGTGDIGMAETFLAAGRQREAWRHIMLGLELRPYDPGVRRLIATILAQGMPPTELERVLDILWERPVRWQQFAESGGERILSTLLERAGDLPGAIEVLGSTPEPRRPSVNRRLRRMQLATGDVRGYLRAFEATIPSPLLDDERNQVRGRWVALFEGPWGDADPLARLDWSLNCATALTAAGQLLEADIMATLALQRHPNGASDELAALRDKRDEARKELAFEHAIRRVLYQGYTAATPLEIRAVIGHLRRISIEIFERDVVGEPEFFQIAMVGTMLDSLGPGLGKHLAKYNKHLVLGQRSGAPAEGLLLTILSKTDLELDPNLPVQTRCWRIIGEHREIQSLQGVLGGDLAGIALLNHYVVDMDAVREWSMTLQMRRSLGTRCRLLADPLPSEVAPMDPVDAHWRLAIMSPVEDSDLDMAVLEMICLHERAHLVDSFHFLPPESNLWRVLGLVVRHGFSALSIEGEMEGKAEHAALCWSEHTGLVLAHIASFLATEAPGSPHALGFRSLAEELHKAFAADPALREFAPVHRWHELPKAQVREIARRLWTEIW